MPRTIEITLVHEKTAGLLEKLREMDGVVGISLLRSAALFPERDVLRVQATNDATHGILTVLKERKILREGSILTSEPRSLMVSSEESEVERESNETIWEEMAFLLRRDTNFSHNFILLMFLAGGIAATGLAVNRLALIIAAMILAPGFEPLLRIPFGLVGGKGGYLLLRQ